jgi:hypothetical protein
MKRASRYLQPLYVTQIAAGDGVYSIEVLIDVRSLARQLGPKAAGSRAGKSVALNGAVVVTAKQANVAGGGS